LRGGLHGPAPDAGDDRRRGSTGRRRRRGPVYHERRPQHAVPRRHRGAEEARRERHGGLRRRHHPRVRPRAAEEGRCRRRLHPGRHPRVDRRVGPRKREGSDLKRMQAVARLGAALLSVAACTRASPPSGSSPKPAIHFIEDDYPRALAEARARGVPLFVDTWATWCHTCLSMRAFVFGDARLTPVADRYVWLSLDTEREENAAL